MQVCTLGRVPTTHPSLTPFLVSGLGSFPVYLLESHWLAGAQGCLCLWPHPFSSITLFLSLGLKLGFCGGGGW